MCGRYVIDPDAQTMQRIYEEIRQREPEKPPAAGEIFPGDVAPILTREGPAAAKWGFPKHTGKGVIINAKAETAEEKRTFRSSFADRRCAVPASGFFEWSRGPAKTKYRFAMPQAELLYLAGLFQAYDGQLCYVILTHGSNASVGDIHDRMPVILTAGQVDDWLSDRKEARSLLCLTSPMLERTAETPQQINLFSASDRMPNLPPKNSTS